jgi:hypothetical protein
VARRASLRASDADRDATAERLRRATVEGRLLAEELDERLGTVFAARTYGELDAVVADLPGPRSPQRRRPQAIKQRPLTHWVVPAIALMLVFPIIVALTVAAMVFVVTGVAAGWVFWLVIGWCFFGARRRFVPRRGPHWTRF